MANKAQKFRELLLSENLEFICEAHNALSAKIVEEAGFRALWASSLTVSAAMGLRDNNEASWTQILEVIELISDATTIPLLLDADTGYGNFNNVQRLVKKLEQRDIAAVCIEDKLFPKKNSFVNGDEQPLAGIEEFAGKIKAAKDIQINPDFSVVARTEAFIAGWGLSEALKRAEAYRKAGADAILVHSKISRPDEILAFKKEWGNRLPVIIVPTKYYTTHTDVFREAGFSAIIWANMILRSSVKAMEITSKQLAQDQSLHNIEDRIAPLAEVFRLQGAEELEKAEQLYLPGNIKTTQALILAASQGAGLGELTKETPKAMLKVRGIPLLLRQQATLNSLGIKDITVVRGFGKGAINIPNLRYVDNDDFADTQEVYSLHLGLKHLSGKTLVSYGDILYKRYIPSLILEADENFVIAVDPEWKTSQNKGRYTDFVACDHADRKTEFDQKVFLSDAGESLTENDISGEWVGLLKLSGAGLAILQNILSELSVNESFRRLRMVELFAELIKRNHKIRVVYIHGHWVDIDDIKDLGQAGSF